MIRICAAVFLLMPVVVCTASEFDDLAKAVPDGANMILAIDVDRIMTTEMAQTNGWANPDNAGNRPIYLPSESDKVVVAAQVDPADRFKQAWEAAVISLKEPLPMRLIAKAEGGYADTINGKSAAWAPSDSYFIEYDESTLGLLHPANKQAASRWIDQQQDANDSGLSLYLAESVRAVTSGPQFMLALDAKDAIPAHRIHQNMTKSKVVEKYKLDVEEMTAVFSSLRGVKLALTFTDKAQASARVEFGRSLPFDADVGKAFVLAALTNLEAELPGIDAWAFRVDQDAIVAEGELSLPGLRRVLSMVEIPTTKFSSLKGEDTESNGDADDMAQKSLTYFHSVTKLIEDLQRHSKSNRGDNFWLDRYAKKIDRLPILYVDPDLLDFGQNTSETLRVMSGARKSANISSGVSRTNIAASAGAADSAYNNYGYNYRGSGYRRNNGRGYGSRARGEERAQNAANKRFQATATSKKLEGFRLIANASSELRRTMTERYEIEF
jgi:hypothetical protein